MRQLILIFLFINIVLISATDVSGIQTGTWNLADSPFTVVGDITIPAGEELIIEPGVLVQFWGMFGITAEGMLIAQGTENDSIYFVRYPTFQGYWDEIRLEQETGEGYEISYCFIRGADNGVNSIDALLHLHHCHLDANNTGVNLFAIGNADPPEVLIEDCLIENSILNGIDIYESNPTIQNNEITNNGMGTQYRGAIQVNIQSDGCVCSPLIINNYIHHNQKQGITCTDMFSAGTISANIQNNILESNLTGVYFYNCSGILNNNQINDNFIPGDMNSGAGVMCYGSLATPVITNNTITGNYTALYIVNNANPCLGNSASMNPLEQGQNTFQDNIDAYGINNSIYVYNCANTYTILAENNTWDSEDFDEIAETIHDHDDVPSLPSVDFDPIYQPPLFLLSGTFNYDGIYVVENWTLAMVSVNYSWDTETYPLEYGSFEFTAIPAGYYYLVIEGRTGGDVVVSGTYGDFRFPEVLIVNESNQYTDLEIEVIDVIDQEFLYVARVFQEEDETLFHLVEGEHYPVSQMLLYQSGDFLKYYGRPVYGEDEWEIDSFLPGDYIYQKNLNLQVGDSWSALRLWGGDESVYLDYTVTARDTLEIGSELKEIFNLEAIWQQSFFFLEQFAAETGIITHLEVNPAELLENNFQLDYENLVLPPAPESFLPLALDYYALWNTQLLPENPWELRFACGIDDSPIILWNPAAASTNCQTYRIYANQEMLAELTVAEQQYPVPLPVTATTDFYVTGWNGSSETAPSNIVTWLVPTGQTADLIEQMQVSLQQNYPNPFIFNSSRNDGTKIDFCLPSADEVKLEIFNIRGEKIKTLIDECRNSGQFSEYWNGKNQRGELCATGIYFYRLSTPKEIISRKLILIR
ncbi:MAG: T9SS type A sorting domain-containing protein [Candidatus Cloacimonetes bacterium]|nr:T9SS type A sorting domain-containing protein [Candidatus Cloacimonadota bacterium]